MPEITRPPIETYESAVEFARWGLSARREMLEWVQALESALMKEANRNRAGTPIDADVRTLLAQVPKETP